MSAHHQNPLERRFFTQRRRQFSLIARQHAAERAATHLSRLHALLPACANIALYQDDFGELPTFGIIQFCLTHGHTPHLPIICGDKLVFAPITARPLGRHPFYFAKKRHRLGMHEPISRQHRPISDMHACFCPLVAIDYQGNRLGMGGGFYDRTLKHYHGLKIGWCYDFQIVPKLNANAWDIGMDMAICPSRLWRF